MIVESQSGFTNIGKTNYPACHSSVRALQNPVSCLPGQVNPKADHQQKVHNSDLMRPIAGTGYSRLLKVATGYSLLLKVTTSHYRLLIVTTGYSRLLKATTGTPCYWW